MKSKTSFFNKGVFYNIVRRYWPAWALYTFVWLLAMPIQFMSGIRYSENVAASFVNRMNAVCGEVTIIMAFASAIIVAMGVFSFLYKQRENSMVASLPVKREAVFGSAFLAGFLPLTAINIIAAILTLLTAAGHINGECVNAVLMWLGTYTLEFIAFYGIACCVAMLTGNIIALPILYGIFNFLAIGIETVIRELVNIFVYGLGYNNELVTEFLSPVLTMLDKTNMFFANGNAFYEDMTGKICPQLRFEGWGVLASYAAVGVVFSVCALLLFRKRKMECTGDVIAVPVLKPVFKYGVAICAAISFGLLIFLIFGEDYNGSARNIGNLIGMIVSMAIGGAVGYFGADMLLKKSFHVFKDNLLGYAAVVAACVVLCLVCRFDALGLGSYVPDEKDIQSVTIGGSYSDARLTDAEAVKEVISLHNSITANLNDISKSSRDMWDGDKNYYSLDLKYTLKNGKTVSRSYVIEETRSEAKQYIELMESDVVRNSLCEFFSKFTTGDVANSSISYRTSNGEWYSCDLTAEQALDLYKNGMDPDIRAGKISFSYLDNEDDDERPTVWIEFDEQNGVEYNCVDFNATISPDCSNTIQWFKDNFGVDLNGNIDEPIVNEAVIESTEYIG